MDLIPAIVAKLDPDLKDDATSLLKTCVTAMNDKGLSPSGIRHSLTGLRNGYGCWLDIVRRTIRETKMDDAERKALLAAFNMATAFLFDIEGHKITKGPDGQGYSTLKDQLEAVIADMERRIADDPDRLYGGDWFQLTGAEEDVFRIDPDRFPRMIMTWECYEVFKQIADAATFDLHLIQQARQQHPEWSGKEVSDKEFAEFANVFGSLTLREAYAIYAKQEFWTVRLGVMTYGDGS